MSGQRTNLAPAVERAGWRPNTTEEVEVREIDRRYAQEAERPSIGHLLERARLNRGVSLKQAEQATRIRRDYLENWRATTTPRCQSPSTCADSSRHTPTIWTSTETGSPRRSGSGRNEGEERGAVPYGTCESFTLERLYKIRRIQRSTVGIGTTKRTTESGLHGAYAQASPSLPGMLQGDRDEATERNVSVWC